MKQNIYDRLGVKKLINAAGTYTMVGGSRMSPESLDAMREAAEDFVDIRDLLARAQERIAQLTNNEAALIVTGAAAGLYVLAAASVSRKLDREFRHISRCEIERCEIIVFRAHRNPYDWSLRQLGVKLVEVGYPNLIEPTTVSELEAAISADTTAIFYTDMRQGWVAEGALDLDSTLRVAEKHGIPVVVDGAAQLPPVENLWSYNHKGAVATIFSGGKDLSGPQSSGLITGSKDFLDVAARVAFPNYGIGRMLKVGREEIAGLLVAVEQYVAMDHEARARWCLDQIKQLRKALAKYEEVVVEDSYPNEAGQPVARAVVIFNHEKVSSDEVIAQLRTGEPGIFAMPAAEDSIFINPMTLASGELEIIAERLDSIFQKFDLS